MNVHNVGTAVVNGTGTKIRSVGMATVKGVKCFVIDNKSWRNGVGITYNPKKRTIKVPDAMYRVFYGIESPPPCNDCQRETHPYMVNDALWIAAGMTHMPGSNLCLPCLALRLKRPLKRTDFSACIWIRLLNQWIKWRGRKLVLMALRAAWEFVRNDAEHAYFNLSGNKTGWPKGSK